MQKIFYSFLEYKDWELALGATNKGLCYIGFEERTNEQLIECCKKQFQNCTFIEGHEKLIPYSNEIIAYLDGTLTTFSIPLHFHGTDFQMKVWNALLSVQYGQTVPYSYISSLINNPKAVRAVGSAIGKNPIPIIIPCHRVIEKNGSFGGFSGGLHIKERLLALENKTIFDF